MILICTALVWSCSIVGIYIMHRIYPYDKLYPVWAVLIAVLYTFSTVKF